MIRTVAANHAHNNTQLAAAHERFQAAYPNEDLRVFSAALIGVVMATLTPSQFDDALQLTMAALQGIL